MAKKEKETNDFKIEVAKEASEQIPQNRPTPEEVLQFKTDFEQGMKEFAEKRFPISEPGQFNANETGMFLMDYLKKYSVWNKTGWMGIIKMNEELNSALKINNEKNGLSLDYQALEFCGYMLTNPSGIGYAAAMEFEKIADKYAQIMMAVGKQIEIARENLKAVQYLQEKWAASEQGLYLADLEPKDTKDPNSEVDNIVENNEKQKMASINKKSSSNKK